MSKCRVAVTEPVPGCLCFVFVLFCFFHFYFHFLSFSFFFLALAVVVVVVVVVDVVVFLSSSFRVFRRVAVLAGRTPTRLERRPISFLFFSFLSFFLVSTSIFMGHLF